MAQSHIRASDAERERVAAFLRDQTAEGRLTPDELDERVGRAYRAVTRGDLRRLVADLPAPRALAAAGPSRVRRRRRAGALPWALAALLLVVTLPHVAWHAGVVGFVLLFVFGLFAVLMSPFLLAGAVAAALLRRHRKRQFWLPPGPPGAWRQPPWR